MISKRRQANKNNPFKKIEIARLRQAMNWDDYPNLTTKEVNMEQNSASSLPGENSSPMDLSKIVTMARDVYPLVSFSENTKKRDHAKPMDTDDIDTASRPKKHKVELNQQIGQVKKSGMRSQMKMSNGNGKQKQDEPITTRLKLQ